MTNDAIVRRENIIHGLVQVAFGTLRHGNVARTLRAVEDSRNILRITHEHEYYKFDERFQ